MNVISFSLKTICLVIVAQSAFASVLTCSSDTKIEGTMKLSLQADVESAKSGVIGDLLNLRIQTTDESGKDVSLSPGNISIDAKYRPRKNKESSRYNLESMEWSYKDYAGVIHGLILPKAAAKSFSALIISSDDPYHDGIYSYYRMNCKID